MTLIDVECRAPLSPVPDSAMTSFLDDANGRIEDFIRRRQTTDPIPSFVVCDFIMVLGTLEQVVDQRLATGSRFCEWGAGFGVVTGIAAMLGMESFGIEIHRDLVDEATSLLEDHHLEATIAHGSLIPDDGDAIVDALAQQAWLLTGESSGYDELDLEPDDFDVFFAYPWPGDEELIDQLFDKFAATGALLLTYHGINEMRLQRKQ